MLDVTDLDWPILHDSTCRRILAASARRYLTWWRQETGLHQCAVIWSAATSKNRYNKLNLIGASF